MMATPHSEFTAPSSGDVPLTPIKPNCECGRHLPFLFRFRRAREAFWRTLRTGYAARVDVGAYHFTVDGPVQVHDYGRFTPSRHPAESLTLNSLTIGPDSNKKD